MKKILSAVILGVMALALCAGPALAAVSEAGGTCGGTTGNTCATTLICGASGTCVNDPVLNPLGLPSPDSTGLGDKTIQETIGRIINVALSFLGVIAIVIILIGGFTWMTAGGNDEKVGEAKKWIFSGIIGLAIILSAYALSAFIINSLVSATGFNAAS